MSVTTAGITSADRSHLERTVALAWEARNRGDHPFGSLLVAADGRVLEARNSVVTDVDPTGHAETNLVRLAGKLDRATRITSTLYTSTEPCAMCAGAIYWSGIGRVVFALSEVALARWSRRRKACLRCICRVGRSSPEVAARSWSTVPLTWLPRPRSTRVSGPRILRVARRGVMPADLERGSGGSPRGGHRASHMILGQSGRQYVDDPGDDDHEDGQ